MNIPARIAAAFSEVCVHLKIGVAWHEAEFWHEYENEEGDLEEQGNGKHITIGKSACIPLRVENGKLFHVRTRANWGRTISCEPFPLQQFPGGVGDNWCTIPGLNKDWRHNWPY